MYSFQAALIFLITIFGISMSQTWKDVSEFRARVPGRCDNTSEIIYFDCGEHDLQCIPLILFHDGKRDCREGSDERCFAGYTNCGPYCVLPESVTDSCSSEIKCDATGANKPSFCPLSKQKLCPLSDSVPCKGYGECVLSKWLLDGKRDCLDGSDEDAAYASEFKGTTTTNPSTGGNGSNGNGSGSTTNTSGGGTGSSIYTTTMPTFVTTTSPSSSLSPSFSSTTTSSSNQGGSGSSTTTAPDGGIVTVPINPDGSGNVGPGNKCYDDALAAAKNKFGKVPICSCPDGQVMDANGKCTLTTVGSVQFRALQLCGKDLTFYEKLGDPMSPDFQNYTYLMAYAISNALESAGLSAAIPSICVPAMAMKPGSVILTVNMQCANNSDSCSAAAIKSALERQTGDVAVRFDPNVTDINECDDPNLNDCDDNAKCERKGFSYTCTCSAGFNDTSPAGYPGRHCTSDVAAAETTCTKVSFLGMCLPLLLFIIAIIVILALLLLLLYLLYRCCCSNRGTETDQVAPLGDPQDAQDVWSNGSKRSGNSPEARNVTPPTVAAKDARALEEGAVAESIQSVQTVPNAPIFPSLLKSGAMMEGLDRMQGIEEIDSILSPELDADQHQVEAVIEDRPGTKRSGGTPTIWETYRKLGQQYARFSSSKTRKSTGSSVTTRPAVIATRGTTAQEARDLNRLNLALSKVVEEKPQIGDASVTELIKGNSQLPSDPSVLAAAVKKVRNDRDGSGGSNGTNASEQLLNPDGTEPYEQWKQRTDAEPSIATTQGEQLDQALQQALEPEDVDLSHVLPRQVDGDDGDDEGDGLDDNLPHHPNAPVYREVRLPTPDSESSSKRGSRSASRAASRAGEYPPQRSKSRNSAVSGARSGSLGDTAGGRPRSRGSAASAAPSAAQQEDTGGAPYKENLWWGHQ